MDEWYNVEGGSILFPRLYEDKGCPLEGYEGYTFRILVNPTSKERAEWIVGDLGTPGCPDCDTKDKDAPKYCKRCTENREMMGRAAVTVFGESKVQGFDFSTPEAALASFEQDIPAEFLTWLYMLPDVLWTKRIDDLKNLVRSPLETSVATS